MGLFVRVDYGDYHLEHALEGDEVVIGTASDCAVLLPSEAPVGPRHVRLLQHVSGTSDDGVYVPGDPRPRYAHGLHPGETLTLDPSGEVRVTLTHHATDSLRTPTTDTSIPSLRTADGDLDRLVEATARQADRLEESQARVRDLEAENDELRRRLAQVEATSQTDSNQLEQLRDLEAKWRGVNDDLSLKLNEREREVDEVRADRTELRRRLEEAERNFDPERLRRSEAERDELAQSLDERRSELNHLKERRSEAIRQNRGFIEKLQVRDKTIERLNQEHERQISNLEQRNTQLHATNKRLRMDLDQSVAQVADLERDCDKLRFKIENQERRHSETADHERPAARDLELQSRVDQLENDKEHLTIQLSDERKRVTSMEQDLGRLQSEGDRERIERELIRTRDRLSSLESEATRVRQENDRLVKETKATQAEADRARAELEEEKTRYSQKLMDEVGRHHKRVEDGKHDVEIKLEEARRRIAQLETTSSRAGGAEGEALRSLSGTVVRFADEIEVDVRRTLKNPNLELHMKRRIGEATGRIGGSDKCSSEAMTIATELTKLRKALTGAIIQKVKYQEIPNAVDPIIRGYLAPDRIKSEADVNDDGRLRPKQLQALWASYRRQYEKAIEQLERYVGKAGKYFDAG